MLAASVLLAHQSLQEQRALLDFTAQEDHLPLNRVQPLSAASALRGQCLQQGARAQPAFIAQAALLISRHALQKQDVTVLLDRTTRWVFYVQQDLIALEVLLTSNFAGH